jgi:hypothetical protein
MEVRVIKSPEYLHLHSVQIKKWWGWKEVFNGELNECISAADNLFKYGVIFEIIYTPQNEAEVLKNGN